MTIAAESFLEQSKHNIDAALKLEEAEGRFRDWQVTCLFYAALHLCKYHLYKLSGCLYESHDDTKKALNPARPLSIHKLDMDTYCAYIELMTLSRRSRYLALTDKGGYVLHRTGEKDFAEAIIKLDMVMEYFQKLHDLKFEHTSVNCSRLIGKKLNYFKAV